MAGSGPAPTARSAPATDCPAAWAAAAVIWSAATTRRAPRTPRTVLASSVQDAPGLRPPKGVRVSAGTWGLHPPKTLRAYQVDERRRPLSAVLAQPRVVVKGQRHERVVVMGRVAAGRPPVRPASLPLPDPLTTRWTGCGRSYRRRRRPPGARSRLLGPAARTGHLHDRHIAACPVRAVEHHRVERTLRTAHRRPPTTRQRRSGDLAAVRHRERFSSTQDVISSLVSSVSVMTPTYV